jgi:hypothetical protein
VISLIEIKAHKRNRTAIYPHTKGEASISSGVKLQIFAQFWGMRELRGVCWIVLPGCTMWA